MYANAAAEHGRATEAGDSKAANRAHDAVAAAYRELRSRGIDAQRALLQLLAHTDAGVRLWAAAHGLEFAPDEAEPVLQALAEDSRLPLLAQRGFAVNNIKARHDITRDVDLLAREYQRSIDAHRYIHRIESAEKFDEAVADLLGLGEEERLSRPYPWR